MTAQAATNGGPHAQRLAPPLAALVHTVVATTILMFLIVSLWLAARRWTGNLHEPLGSATLIAVGVFIAVLASSFRLAWRLTGTAPVPWRSPAAFLWILASLSVLLLATALSITGTPPFALLLFWCIVLSAEGMWYRAAWRAIVRGGGTGRPSRKTVAARERPLGETPVVPRDVMRRTAPVGTAASRDPTSDEDGERLPDDVCQQLTRTHAEQPGDTVTGLLRAHFQPGERSRSLHVAFCPPMVALPAVEVLQLTGPQTRVKAANIQSFGVRFDLRLATASPREEGVLIHFEARVGEQRAAASHSSAQ